jgi:hypothetical protein
MDLHEELRNLFCSPYTIRILKSRRIRYAERVVRVDGIKNANIFVGKPEGRTTLGRPMRRWEGDIKMDID